MVANPSSLLFLFFIAINRGIDYKHISAYFKIVHPLRYRIMSSARRETLKQ